MSTASSPTEAQLLFRTAYQYEQLGDVYHAVKLYRKAIKVAPRFAAPYFQLCKIYKHRKEWKPTLHYGLKTLECSDHYPSVWNFVAAAATALGKSKVLVRALPYLAKAALQNRKVIPVQISHGSFKEIVWAKPLHPLKARIISIPHPNSRRRFGEIILHDWHPIGYRVIKNKRYPLFEELERLKTSHFHTFSVLLHDSSEQQIQQLEQLCSDAGIGFEVWSNMNFNQINTQSKQPEYYDQIIATPEQAYTLIALAAKERETVDELLNTWRIITLAEYSQLERHF